jgi:hypothetical protein
MIAHRRWHRITFCLAGAYNILWGLYAALDPLVAAICPLSERCLAIFLPRDCARYRTILKDSLMQSEKVHFTKEKETISPVVNENRCKCQGNRRDLRLGNR